MHILIPGIHIHRKCAIIRPVPEQMWANGAPVLLQNIEVEEGSVPIILLIVRFICKFDEKVYWLLSILFVRVESHVHTAISIDAVALVQAEVVNGLIRIQK